MIPIASVLNGGLAAESSGAADPRLKPAAHEFEACLLKEFLEPLQKDPLFAQDGEGSSGAGSGNALMSFGSEALARAISERGGFGIAAKIIDHFAAPNGGQESSPFQNGHRIPPK